MNRNVESHFSEVPYIDKPRSIMDMSASHRTSFNSGELVPFFLCQQVLPGDTWRVTTSKVIRLQTLLQPIYDNLYLDTYYFFIPWRLVWSHVREFFGENTTSAWVQTTPYKIPGISSPSGGFNVGTIADHFGLPTGVSWTTTDKACPSALPFRAYAMVCDTYFRDENLTDPLNIPTGDSDQTGTNGSSYINDVANGGALFKVAKYHDYFTSCLPAPQKSQNPVTIPIYQQGTKVPVVPVWQAWTDSFGSDAVSFTPASYPAPNVNPYDRKNSNGIAGNTTETTVDGKVVLEFSQTAPTYYNQALSSGKAYYSPNNLWAKVGDVGADVTVNQLRLAFALQRYYEHLASGGSRYIEWVKEFFGTVSSDARLQRPEYLGGNRIPLQINEVLNHSQSANDFLGDTGAMSATSDIHEDFVKSFTEHGILLGCMCIRSDRSYSQGIHRDWTRRTLEDQYNPTWAHLGEMPVYKYEIYADGNMDNDAVFGYNEAWSSYRYGKDLNTGEMRPGIANTLASWHLGDYYTSSPTLSDSWIREDVNILDRCLAVGHTVSNQAFADLYTKAIVTRVMPMYSVPGLIDHF